MWADWNKGLRPLRHSRQFERKVSIKGEREGEREREKRERDCVYVPVVHDMMLCTYAQLESNMLCSSY